MICKKVEHKKIYAIDLPCLNFLWMISVYFIDENFLFITRYNFEL